MKQQKQEMKSGDEAGTVPDPLDLADWKFYVAATSLLNRERPIGQRGSDSIGIRPLAALIRKATGMDAVGFDGLREAIQQADTRQ